MILKKFLNLIKCFEDEFCKKEKKEKFDLILKFFFAILEDFMNAEKGDVDSIVYDKIFIKTL